MAIRRGGLSASFLSQGPLQWGVADLNGISKNGCRTVPGSSPRDIGKIGRGVVIVVTEVSHAACSRFGDRNQNWGQR